MIIAAMASIIISCSGTNNKPTIKFSADSSSIIIQNFDQATMIKAKEAYQNHSDAESLLSVLLLPGDTDSIQDQLPVAGTIALKGDSIIFNPETPFQKNKTYLVESFVNAKFATAEKLISGSIKQTLQPQKQILKR